MSINLSQYPESLIESELFGHRKGAFTGAIEPHKGVFSRCSPFGSIFIDEIGDVSIPVHLNSSMSWRKDDSRRWEATKQSDFRGGLSQQPINRLLPCGKKENSGKIFITVSALMLSRCLLFLQQRLDENPDEIKVILDFTVTRILGRESIDLVDKISALISDNQPPGYRWPGNIRELEQCARQILLRQSYHWQNNDEERQKVDLLAERETLTAQELLSDTAAICI